MMATASSPRVETTVDTAAGDEPSRAAHWQACTGEGADLERHVHLVVFGLPGAGTSTIGRLVAHELQRPYVDHDSIVALGRDDADDNDADEPAADDAAPDDPDEDHAAVCRVLGTHASIVYGIGGHVVEHLAPADIEDAYLVWLDASPEVTVDRIGEREHPALGPEPLPALRSLAARLDPVARDLCDLRVDIDHIEPADAAERIRSAWRHHVDELGTQQRSRRVS